nr:hypothetical protein [Tanacetum cinerariifolium]
MEINIEEDENEMELTYPYEEVDPLNPSPPASESEPDDEIEVENPIEHADETVLANPMRIMPPKSAPMTQAAIRQTIKDSVGVAIAAERARQANVEDDASGSGPVRGQDAAPAVRECTFTGFMKCNPAVKLRRWFEKTKSVFEINECAEGKKVKFVAATLEVPALTWRKTKVATMGFITPPFSGQRSGAHMGVIS